MQQAQQGLKEAAGEGGAGVELLPPSDWDEASSTVSGAPEPDDPPGSSQVPPEAEALRVPTTMLQVDAQLGELAIFGSGREPSPWWPPPPSPAAGEAGSGAATAAQTRGGGGKGQGHGIVSVDSEVPLIAMRASGGAFSFTYGTSGMTGWLAARGTA